MVRAVERMASSSFVGVGCGMWVAVQLNRKNGWWFIVKCPERNQFNCWTLIGKGSTNTKSLSGKGLKLG